LDKLIYINESRDKFARRLEDGFMADGVGFTALYEMKLSDREELTINKLEGIEKMYALARNIYRSEVVFDAWKMTPQLTKNCLLATQRINVYSIERPRDKNTVGDIIEFITKNTEYDGDR
jgi:hypothetical protein